MYLVIPVGVTVLNVNSTLRPFEKRSNEANKTLVDSSAACYLKIDSLSLCGLEPAASIADQSSHCHAIKGNTSDLLEKNIIAPKKSGVYVKGHRALETLLVLHQRRKSAVRRALSESKLVPIFGH